MREPNQGLELPPISLLLIVALVRNDLDGALRGIMSLSAANAFLEEDPALATFANRLLVTLPRLRGRRSRRRETCVANIVDDVPWTFADARRQLVIAHRLRQLMAAHCDGSWDAASTKGDRWPRRGGEGIPLCYKAGMGPLRVEVAVCTSPIIQ